MDAVLDAASPIPVLLHARSLYERQLKDAVIQECSGLGDPTQLGVRLVLDGLDEVRASTARRLVSQASVLASAWPSTSVAAFSKPDIIYHGATTAALPIPSPDELERLASTIVGRTRPFSGLNRVLQLAVQLPLYAVALSVLVQRQQEVPESGAAILGALVRTCMRDEHTTDEELLRRLAVQLTVHKEVSEADFGSSEARRVAESRLVMLTDGQIRFSVPIYQEWFAAQALLFDDAIMAVKPHDPWAFESWRYEDPPLSRTPALRW